MSRGRQSTQSSSKTHRPRRSAFERMFGRPKRRPRDDSSEERGTTTAQTQTPLPPEENGVLTPLPLLTGAPLDQEEPRPNNKRQLRVKDSIETPETKKTPETEVKVHPNLRTDEEVKETEEALRKQVANLQRCVTNQVTERLHLKQELRDVQRMCKHLQIRLQYFEDNTRDSDVIMERVKLGMTS